MLNFPFRQTFYFTLKCNIAVQNIVKKANVCTKFCLNLSIHSQDIEQKPNFDVKQGP